MLLAAAQLADEKNGIDHHPRNNQGKKDNPKKQQHTFAPVEDDPANIERNRQRHQADAQEEKKNDGSTAARNAHSGSSRFYRVPRAARQLRRKAHEQKTPASRPGLSLF